MEKRDIDAVLYLRKMISEGREDEIDVRRLENISSGSGYFYNGFGIAPAADDLVITTLIESGSTKAIRLIRKEGINFHPAVNVTPLIIHRMLEDDDDEFITEAIGFVSEIMDGRYADKTEMITAAAALGRYDIILDTVRKDNFLFDTKYEQCVTDAVKNEDRTLFDALTDRGKLLLAFHSERQSFGIVNSKWLLSNLLLNCVSNFRNNNEHFVIGPEEILAGIGRMLGTGGAAETFRYCLEASEPEEKLNGLMLSFSYIFRFRKNDLPEQNKAVLSRASELCGIIAASGVRPSNISACIENFLCSFAFGDEELPPLDFLRGFFPNKFVTSCVCINGARLEKFSRIFDGEMVFSLDDNKGDITPKASYLRCIGKYMRLEYTGSFERNEKSLMARMLRTQKISVIQQLIESGLINERNSDNVMAFCVENKLYNVIKILSEIGS